MKKKKMKKKKMRKKKKKMRKKKKKKNKTNKKNNELPVAAPCKDVTAFFLKIENFLKWLIGQARKLWMMLDKSSQISMIVKIDAPSHNPKSPPTFPTSCSIVIAGNSVVFIASKFGFPTSNSILKLSSREKSGLSWREPEETLKIVW